MLLYSIRDGRASFYTLFHGKIINKIKKITLKVFSTLVLIGDTFQMYLEFRMLVFEERGKPEYPEKNLSRSQ